MPDLASLLAEDLGTAPPDRPETAPKPPPRGVPALLAQDLGPAAHPDPYQLGAALGAAGGVRTIPERPKMGPPIPARQEETPGILWPAIKGTFSQTQEDISGGQQKTVPRVLATSAATGLKTIPADVIGLLRYTPTVKIVDAVTKRLDPTAPSLADTLANVPASVEAEHQRQMEGQALEHPLAQFVGQTEGQIAGAGALFGGTGAILGQGGNAVPAIARLGARYPATLGRSVGAVSALLDQAALSAGSAPPDTTAGQAARQAAGSLAGPQGLGVAAVGALGAGIGRGGQRAEAATPEAPASTETAGSAASAGPPNVPGPESGGAPALLARLAEAKAAGAAARAPETAVPAGSHQPTGGAGGSESGAGAGGGPAAEPGAGAGPAAAPGAPSVSQPSADLKLQGMGQAIADNLYRGVYERLQQGKLPGPFPADKQPPAERAALAAWQAGDIHSEADVKRVMQAVGPPGGFPDTPIPGLKPGDQVVVNRSARELRTTPEGGTRMEMIVDPDGRIRLVPADQALAGNVSRETGGTNATESVGLHRTSGGGAPVQGEGGVEGAPDLGPDGSRARILGAGEGGGDEQEGGAAAGPQGAVGSPGEAGFIGRRGPPEKPPVTFSDPAVEAKFQHGRQGFDTRRTIADRWRTLSDGLARIGKAFTMENPNVSAGAEDAPLREVLRQQRATVPVAMQDIGNFFKRGIQTLAEPQRDLFERKLLLDDLRADEKRFGRDPDQALPNGLTWDEVDRAGPAVDKAVAADPRVQKVLEQHRAFWGQKRDEYANALNDLGLPSDWLYAYGDSYMHHAVMDRMNPPTTEPLPPGVMPARGWQKGRGAAPSGEGAEGHQLNLNYAQGQLPVLTQMAVDTQRLRAIKTIDDQYGLAGADRDAALKGNVPTGYTAVDPYTRYRQLFVGDGLKERAISELAQAQVAKGLGVPEARALAEAEADANATIVIPRHVDAALKYQESMVKPGPLMQLWHTATNKMKVFDVAAPWRVPAFFARKFAGDTSKIILNAPGATENIPWATQQVLRYNTGGKIDPVFDDFRKLGGLPGTFFAQEAGISDAQRLAELRGDNPLSIEAKKAAGLGGAYTRTFRRGTEFADSVPRASAYKYFFDKLEASPDGTLGGPENYGASMKAEVDALPTNQEKAYWLANQAIGAYDMVPEAARMMRRTIFPFTSVQWTNLAGDIRSLRNQLSAPQTVGAMSTWLGKQGVRAAGFLGYRAAKFATLAYGLELAQQVSNRLFFSDEEDRLPEDVRKEAHINLGQDAEGNDRFIRRTSLFKEARDWVAADEMGYAAHDWLQGRRTAAEAAGDVASHWIDHLWNSVSALVKAPFEMTGKYTTYPSVTHSGHMDSRLDYLLGQLGISPELAYAEGRPTLKGNEGVAGRIASHVFSYSNPDVTAYYDTMANRDRFLQSAGLAPEQLGSAGVGEKERALRDYKLALAYGEPKVAAAKLLQYATLGGTERGMAEAFQRLNPLGPIEKLDAEQRFRDYLGRGTSAEHKLDRAQRWWQSMQDQNADFLDRNPSLAAAFDKATEGYQAQQDALREAVADR